MDSSTCSESISFRYPAPPPTANNLDTTQRARLMRSTKKLGELLGTTPHLMETCQDLPRSLLPIGSRTSSPAPSYRSCSSSKSTKSSRRQGSIFTHSETSSICSATSSVTSFALPYASSSSSVDLLSDEKAYTPHRPNDANRPCPLVLHINPVTLYPTDPRITPPTPTPTASFFSPITPTFNDSLVEKQNAEARRRKMAKITRTLGENVPQELVFRATQAPTCRPRALSNARRTRNRRSMSLSAVVPQMWSTGPLPSAQHTQVAWVGEWNRGDIRDVQKQLRGLKAR